jgi:stress response protein YsnF
MEEIVIVTKQLVLKEEIRITRRREQPHYHEIVPLRAEEVEVKRLER